jgi:PAS domain S-box-containing protein
MLKSKRLKRELDEALRRFRLLFEHAPVGVFRTDAKGTVVESNPKWAQIFGRDGLDAGAWRAGIHWVDAIPYEGRWRDAVARAGELAVEFRYVRPDGREVHCFMQAAPLRDAEGAVAGWVGTVEDRTEQRQFQDELQRGDLYRLLVEGTREYAIFLLDPEGRVATWNAGAQLILGHIADVVGQSAEAFYLPEDVAAGKPKRAIAIAAQAGHYEEDGMLRRKDGSRFFASTVITALRGGDGRVRGFSQVTRDISERQYVQRELERSNRDLRDFAAIVSHDLQSPLSTITLNAAVVRERERGKLAPDAMERLERVETTAVRMAEYIRSILDYSRTSFQEAPMDAVDLNHVVTVVSADLEQRLKTTEGRIEAGPLPSVWGNRIQLTQLLQNLLSNALKYHRPGVPPLIKVTAESFVDGLGWRFWRVAFADNGLGFDPQDFDRMTRPFGRRERGVEGYGLGLATCLKIVERHRGRFSAESKPGEGSTFFVDLPVR